MTTETTTEETAEQTTERTVEQRVTGLEQASELLALGFQYLASQVGALSEIVTEKAEDDEDEKPETTAEDSRPDLNVLRDAAYDNAVDKGFHDLTPDVGQGGWMAHDAMKLALIHAEVSEALEALRDGDAPDDLYYSTAEGVESNARVDTLTGKLNKPEGVPAELADVIIRMLDYCGSRGIDIAEAVRVKMAYNATRPAMHGKRF